MLLTSTIPSSTLGELMSLTLPATQELSRETTQNGRSITKLPSSSNTFGKLRDVPLPPAASTKKRPGPYPKNLTL
jgi:hypothetical protein